MNMVTELTDRSQKDLGKPRHARRGASGSGSARPVQNRRSPERKCIVTGHIVSSDLLIRFVLSPDGSVVPDLKRRLEGRGVWVTATHSCVKKAVEKGQFAHGFRSKIEKPEHLLELIDALLEKACLNALGLARKAGKIALGQAKVEAEARKRVPGIILHASDGAPDGQRKIRNALRAAGREDKDMVIREFTSNQLSLALGMPNVIHAALPGKGIAVAFAKTYRDLMRYREKETSGSSAAQAKSRNVDPDNVVEFPSEGTRTE